MIQSLLIYPGIKFKYGILLRDWNLCGLINEWCINLILISFPEKNKEPIFSNSMNNHFVLGIMWQLTSLCLLVFFFFLLFSTLYLYNYYFFPWNDSFYLFYFYSWKQLMSWEKGESKESTRSNFKHGMATQMLGTRNANFALLWAAQKMEKLLNYVVATVKDGLFILN